tara:strand:- start:1600 stop:2175 length:576 start_codon:yes stop_codon:yes gene_type:complete
MIKIGILGDIGSGKTFIARNFGCPIFNADLEVSKVYKNNKSIYKKLKKKFPNNISSFPIKKKEIGEAILEKKNNLIKIVRIVHPIIRIKMNNFLKKNKNKKIVLLDVPLLLENNLNKENYILIFIKAKRKDILKRLKQRSNYNPKLFNKLRKLQLPLEIKKKKSDYIIENNFKSFSIKKSVKILKKKILKK